jgi:Ca-activated chloride channel family protein
LGFGTGNLKDATMEQLADKGNGNYSYIDNLLEAKKVLVNEMGGTLVTIASDVKIQVEFNPAKVKAYRLVGYENRLLNAEDFNDDKKDAGELGSGHTVTALYEIIPAGSTEQIPGIDSLKYQKPAVAVSTGDEVMTIKFRYKEPGTGTSKLITSVLKDDKLSWTEAGEDARFAAAVAEFGMLLRQSDYKGTATYDAIKAMALSGKGKDENGYRAEFISLVEVAQMLDHSTAKKD